MKKTKENKKYWFENYKANKNAKPVVYNGVEYLSKAQCMALEGITRKELDLYLQGESDLRDSIDEVEKTVEDAIKEEMVEPDERDEDLMNLEDLL